MKSMFKITGALLLASTISVAQAAPQTKTPPATGSTASPAPSQSQPAKPGEVQTPPSSKPGEVQTLPTTGQPATPAPVKPNKGQPQAKTQEELAAFNAVMGQADLKAAEAAADEFNAKYPQSELRVVAYSNLMMKANGANDAEMVLSLAKKALTVDAEYTIPLVMSAYVLSETVRETDLDRNEKHAEAIKNAETAIRTIENLPIPPTATPEQASAFKTQILAMANGAIGNIKLVRKEYADAEKYLLTATGLAATMPDALTWLRLAVAQDNLKKYSLAMASVDKAIAAAQPGSNTANLAKGEKDRLTKLMATPAASVPAPTKP